MKEDSLETQSGYWKIGSLFRLALYVLLLCAVVSHSKEDLYLLDGGMDEPLVFRNWIGLAGAHVARALFFLFGLAVYPLLAALGVSLIRSFLPGRVKSGGRYGAILAMTIGFSILFAMYPEKFILETDALGLGRMESTDMVLSGGIIGSKLAAPAVSDILEAGLVKRFIGDVGSLIVAGFLILPSVAFLFIRDWYPVVVDAIAKRRDGRPDDDDSDRAALKELKRRKREEEELARKKRAEEDREDDEDEVWTPRDGRNASATLPQSVETSSKHDDEESRIAPPPAVPETERKDPSKGALIPDDEETKSLSNDDDDDDYVVTPPIMIPSAPSYGIPVAPTAQPGASSFQTTPRQQTTVAESGADEDDDETSVRLPSQPQTPSRNPQPPTTQFAHEKPNYDRQKPEGSDSSASAGGGIYCPNFQLPLPFLLDKHPDAQEEDASHIQEARTQLDNTLQSFNVEGQVSEITVGPRVTQFEIKLAQGVMVEKVTRIQNNIAMNLKAQSIRIRAPIPGKDTVGIEVPNKVGSIVYLRPLLESAAWKESKYSIPIILGRDIAGRVMMLDLAKAPHLLIAGSTGSGKSVCMNTLVMSLLFRFSPSQLRLIMVDPKVVELEMYRPLPHLITPVVNDPKKVPLALRWGVNEMERRYKVLAKVKAKNLAAFNSRPMENPPVIDDDGKPIPAKLPLLIIIVDELADIMMTDAKSDVETSICRIAQKGRAAGIHLVIATQTPRKDVVTGLIKANLPTKIAFKVGSNMDSRVILDSGGAEKLLGNGDMLFNPIGASNLERVQGSFVSDPEIQKVVDFVCDQCEQHFDTGVVAEAEVHDGSSDDDDGRESDWGKGSRRRSAASDFDDDDDDDVFAHPSSSLMDSVAAKYLQPGDGELMRKALEIIINDQQVSTSFLQRRLGIGYNKSADLIDKLEQRGIISPPLPGGQKRNILITDGLETNEDL